MTTALVASNHTYGIQRLSFSLDEVAASTSLSRKTVCRLIASGNLTAKKVGGRVLVPASAVAALVGETIDTITVPAPQPGKC
jgi:excisionase family DNA binding protein